MRFNEFKENKSPDLISAFRDFLPIAMEVLELKTLPKIKLEKQLETDEQPSFGRFVHNEEHSEIEIAIANRHPIDIIRTLAHELVHYKQYTEKRLDHESGRTGSPEENEAHVKAGIILRLFDKKFPNYFSSASVVLENFKDGRNPQDKGDSKRHNVPTKGKISTLRKIAKQGGRRGQLAHWMANMRSGRKKKSNEEYATGPAAQVRGSDPTPKAKPGRTKHPFHGKLVGGNE